MQRFIKKKYNQKKDKKKICPKCKGNVFNATLKCKLLTKENEQCGFEFMSRKNSIIKEILNNIIVTLEKNNKNNDILILNKLIENNDARCLSPYKTLITGFITPKNILRRIKPKNLNNVF